MQPLREALAVRNEQFNAGAVEYRTEPATGDPVSGTGQWLHKTTAHIGGQQVGFLDWHPLTGRVHMVSTHEDFRRRGIATGMWQHSQITAGKLGLTPPRHSDIQMPAGRAWAQGMLLNSGKAKPRERKPPRRAPGDGQEALF